MGREARANKSQEHAKFFQRTDPKEKEQNEKDWQRAKQELYGVFKIPGGRKPSRLVTND